MLAGVSEFLRWGLRRGPLAPPVDISLSAVCRGFRERVLRGCGSTRPRRWRLWRGGVGNSWHSVTLVDGV